MHQHRKTPRNTVRGNLGYARIVYLVTALGLAAALGLAMDLTAGSTRPGLPPVTAATAADPDASRFILNALLVPALDSDAVPLRWTDPRPAMHCGPETAVRVNGKPLRPGELVPNAPFELEWQTDDCHPFGAHGPRFDGRVRLMIYREDWGFSAMVQPSGLRATTESHDTTLIQPGMAATPQSIQGG